jgi:hypothetical protein
MAAVSSLAPEAFAAATGAVVMMITLLKNKEWKFIASSAEPYS